MTLLAHHRQKLESCGLTPDTWTRARLHSVSPNEAKEILGYGTGGGGLGIFYDEMYSRIRIDNPGPDGKRYRSPKGQGNRLYIPRTLEPALLKDPTKTLYITEGELKALKATQEGFPCLALPGVWSWRTKLHGKFLPIADLDRVMWKGRRAILVFDSDLADKPPVAWAEHALCQELRRRGAEVYVLRLPHSPTGEKLGLDDYLAAFGVEAFKALPMHTLAEADRESDSKVYLRVSEAADAYLHRVHQPHHRIALGYPEVEGVLRGVAPGEVMQILGRSGVGKTAFLLNLLSRMTAEHRHPTLLLTLEQQAAEIFERMTSLVTGLSGRDIEQRAREEDPQFIERLLDVCQDWDHVVLMERPCTLDRLDGVIEMAKTGGFWIEPLRLVAIDYAGLIGARRPASAYDHASETAKELKRLAKKHLVGIVSVCQIGREGESGGEPVTLRSARDSGVIEEAADYVLGIWRPELKEGAPDDQVGRVRNKFKLRVLKNRCGPAPVTFTLKFEPSSLRITPAASSGERQ
jgi:DnaB-like helicase C terminal domain/Domain of unknown function (DUF3854)